MFISNGIINGSGNTIVTMIFSLLSLWVIRVPLTAVLTKTSLGISGVWLSVVISYAIVMTVSLMYYYSGKWKKTVIKSIAAKPQS
jgi:Na+-driven multidrug efflux pump